MRTSLGPGESDNTPIWVTMANGNRRVSFGFEGMIIKEGRAPTALFRIARNELIKVEQVQPYEWKEVVPLYKQVGAKVRIQDGLSEWHGQIGTYVEFDEHASEGDFFGVRVDSDTVAFFRREDLEVIS